ncbi:MAG: hypothetical protein RL518_1918 [Pseudomonadota bacterium]|jgi:hypothetical protein
MEELLFHNSKIVSVSLAVCAVLATIGAMLVARRMLFMSSASIRHFFELRFRPTALRYTEEFESLFDAYREKAQVLGNYTPDYSAVFNEANWTKLILTLDQLSSAYRELCNLLDQGESKDALCLAEFLIAAGDELAPWKYNRISDEWAPLANWEVDVHTILCEVVEDLRNEVRRSQGLGVSRGAPVHETMMVLEKIREKL